jgi:hypothetical protein
MKSYHWNSFVPTEYGIDNIFVGTYPAMGAERFENQKGFGFLQYRLKVDEAHNGWDHFLGMYTGMQGVSWANACVKENMMPGYYQFFFWLNFPRPKVLPGVSDNADKQYIYACYKASMFFGQDSYAATGYNAWNAASENNWMNHANYTEPTRIPASEDPEYRVSTEAQVASNFWIGAEWDESIGGDSNAMSGKIMDIGVFRPSLVQPNENYNLSVPLWNSTADSYMGWQMFFTGIPFADPYLVDTTLFETTP